MFFDVSSLFTNVPLDETIKICSEALYDQSNSRPVIPKYVFVELMKSAASSVEFSFNTTMYKQTDEVAMGSPLGPALANIFVGYYEEKLFSQTQKPPTYFRYVDDTFAIFDHEAEVDEFLTKLNCLHPSLKFTFEKEKGKCLPFLDVYVEGTDVGLETSVYRKPTFTGQYLRWESFSPLKRIISPISTLVLSLLLTEVMKIARLTSPLLDVPRRSLPRPRLRHGRRPALLFHLNLILNLCTLFFDLLLALLPRLLPLLTFLTVFLPRNRLRFMPLT